jgi:hopanoid biosynthesis associated RND transporter like protein HpnN
MSTERTAQVEDSLLAVGVASLARAAARRPGWTLALVALSCLFSLCYTWKFLAFHTQRNDLISKNKDYYQRWQRYVAEFGEDNDMVVVVQGTNRARMQTALDVLAADLEQRPDLFDRVFHKVDLRHLQNRSLLYLSVEEIRRIQDHLQHLSKLLLAGSFSQDYAWKSVTLLNHLYEAVQSSSTLRNSAEPRPEQDPVLRQLNATCVKANRFLSEAGAYESPWERVVAADPTRQTLMSEPQYFFSPDGSLAFLTARPRQEESDGFACGKESIEALRARLGPMRERFPDLEFGLTGMPVLEYDEMIASQSDSNTASWLALLGVAILYFVVYRGLRYPLMTIASLLVGTAWALGWLTFTVGHLNILSSAFAVMLIGMGDYGVLWVTRFGQERLAGAEVHEANHATALHVGPSVVTAAITTAMSFFAAMLADLKAVAELGWIAGCGVLLCAASCFVVMPALLALFDYKSKREADTPPLLPFAEHAERRRPWLPGLLRRPGLVIAVSAGATLILGYYAMHVRYDHNLLRIQAQDLDSVRWEHTLLQRTAGANIHAVSHTSTPEEALALKERLESLPGVSRVDTVAALVPREQDRKREQLRDIQTRLRSLPARDKTVVHELPDVKSLRQAEASLQESLDALYAVCASPFLVEVKANLRQLVTRIEQTPGGAARLKAFQERMVGDLIRDLHALRDSAGPGGIEVSDIPPALRERFVGATGRWLLRVYSRENLWEYDALADFVAQVRSVDSEASGRPFSLLEGLRGMRNGFLWAALYALIAMVIVLLLDFGSARHTAVALVPLAMGMVVTLGVMALLGCPLNPANMIAFPLILGVGADNGVHVMHDYRGRTRGRRYTLSHTTGRGIMVAALTTILGFGTLMISQHRGMASLGLALTLGVSCCMLTALVFLPALLGLLSLRRQENVALIPVPFTAEKAA